LKRTVRHEAIDPEVSSCTESLTRGRIAEITGFGVETLIYYEKIGLIPSPHRAANGYREYSSDDVHRLNFIRMGKSLGFSLNEIGEVLRIAESGGGNRDKLRNGIHQKIDRIDRTIKDLRSLRKTLSAIAESPKIGECGIMKSIMKKNTNTY